MPHLAVAEVFNCTTIDGKISYSGAPCAAAGAKETIVPIVATPAPDPGTHGKNWAAENAAANARAFESIARQSAATQKASAPSKIATQIAAECEADHGVNCSSAQEVAQRESEQRALTPDEEVARRIAVAGKREREKAAADAKAKAEAKPKGKS